MSEAPPAAPRSRSGWVMAGLGALCGALALTAIRQCAASLRAHDPTPAPPSGPATPVRADHEEAPVGADAEPVATLTSFAEGPAWHVDGFLLFSAIGENGIRRYEPGGPPPEMYMWPSSRANGLMFDAGGDLVVCKGNEHGPGGGRALVRFDPISFDHTVIAERSPEGARFNSPNDLDIAADGAIYFTDPYYGEDPEALELGIESVYRVAADGRDLTRVLGSTQVVRPNGVLLGVDERTLYVTDTHRERGVQRLYAFALGPDGTPTGARRTVYDFGEGRGGDGMCIDVAGSVHVAAGAHRPPGQAEWRPAGLYVFSPDDDLERVIPIDDLQATNCAFGGPDLRTIFITGVGRLWSVRAPLRGQVRWPSAVDGA